MVSDFFARTVRHKQEWLRNKFVTYEPRMDLVGRGDYLSLVDVSGEQDFIQ
jgi:hypothetical protein